MVSEMKVSMSRKLERDLVTRTPFCCTMVGSAEVTSESLFCTFTCAMSSLVSGVNVRLTVPRPLASALVVM